MANWTQQQMDTVLETVWRRSAFDADFRAFALINPAAAINTVAGVPLPKLPIRFVEQHATMANGPEKMLTLPPLLPVIDKRAARLESVAGGLAPPPGRGGVLL